MTRTRKLFVASLSAVLLVAMGGVGLAESFTVKGVAGDAWKKVHTYIGKGDRVTWKNVDSEDHDVKAYGGGWKLSEELSPGERVSKRFRQKGTYRYRCVIHSGIVGGKCQGMCGFIHVL